MRKRRPLPLMLVILIDLCLIGSGLVIFALFHHALPRQMISAGITLYRQPVTLPSEPSDTVQNTPSETTSSTTVTKPPSSPSTDHETTTAQTVAESDDAGSNWRTRFADQFTDGSVIRTASEYRSADLAITVKKMQRDDTVYFVADIYLTDIRQLRTAFALGTYAHGLKDSVLDMAQENEAILAMSGDYYGIRDQGIVVRNGVLFRDVLFEDVLLLYGDGRMETMTADAFSMDRLLNENVWQVWSFGPMLLDQGRPMTQFNSRVNPENPRSAIGYYEPGHYCFVLVDGRQSGYSEGMTLTELSQLFYDLNCTVAYNLDGGKSAVMTVSDQIVNHPYEGGREISDIIYIAEIDEN